MQPFSPECPVHTVRSKVFLFRLASSQNAFHTGALKPPTLNLY